MPVDTHEDIVPATGIEAPDVVETHEDIKPAMGVTAYHGTPHDFEQFDIGKIGTGEGAQAYGHGLYFAENEDVARMYRDALARPYYKTSTGENVEQKYGADTLEAFNSVSGDPQAVRETIDRLRRNVRANLDDFGVSDISKLKPLYEGDLASNTIEAAKRADNLESLLKSGDVELADTGHMYEVRLNAGPEHLLDWDKPLSEQHPNIISAIKDTIASAKEDAANPGDLRGNFQGSDSTQYGTPEEHDHLTGAAIHDMISRVYGYKDQSNELSKRGIRGIRYLDAGSRRQGAKTGSSNYVIFDPKHIQTVRKYAAGGGIKAFLMHEPHEVEDRRERAYGGAIPGPAFDKEEPEQFGRRLIEWAFAAAPIVSRGNTPSFAGQWKYPNIHMRKDGGRVDYPLAMTEDAKKAKKGAKIKGMKPEKFLDEARPLNIGKGDRQVIDNFKRDIVSGDPLGPLKLYKDGTEDGRHRATAAQELGVSSVPVIDHRAGKYYGGGMGGGSMGGMGGFKGFSPGFKGSRSRYATSPTPQAPNEINTQQQQQQQNPEPYARAQMTSTGMLRPPVAEGVQQGSISRLPNYAQGFSGGYPTASPQQPLPLGQPSNYPTGGFYDVWGPMFGMAMGSYLGGLGGFGGFGGFGGGYADGGAVDDDEQRELTPQGFYSAAAEAATKIPQKAPIDQILNKLKGSPNVKAEELDWSGVRDAFAGQKSVDPAQVAQHLQKNLPQIQETVYKENNPKSAEARFGSRTKITTPGGQNYREVLLHLPEKDDENYNHGHYPEVKNILAHLRMSDRGMYSFGYPEALHLEEVQSDWGQNGRDEGFAPDSKEKSLFQWVKANHPKFLQEVPTINSLQEDYAHPNYTQDQKDLLNEYNEYIESRRDKLPLAPHVTATEGWTDLALKRALMEAAKGKYKKLTWTPGENQAERYGLDKSFSQIHYSPDTKHLFAKGHDGVEDINMNVHEGALPNLIGKELSEKLLSRPSIDNKQPSVKGDTVKSLIGGQLAVPQKGMRDYYDRMIPNRLQKIISKLDPEAKVQLYGHKIFVPEEEGSEEGEYKKVHSLEITPKLRAAILKGLSAYDHGGSVIKDALGVVSKYSR